MARTAAPRLVKPKNLALARVHAKMTQQELANALSAKVGRTLNVSTISSWEKDKRGVPRKYIAGLSSVLGVTIDYLVGNTQKMDEKVTKMSEDETDEDYIPPIDKNDMLRFDNTPVWVEFIYGNAVDGWALYDAKREVIIMKERTYKANDKLMRYYPAKPGYAIQNPYFNRRKVMEVARFYKAEAMYIVYDSPDPGLRKLYTGWYHHNENHTAIMNAEGLTLPYEGLNKYYQAYDDTGLAIKNEVDKQNTDSDVPTGNAKH